MAAPITVEQYEGFQGYPGLRDELIFGQIVISPQPKPFHQQIVRNVEQLLDAMLRGTGYTAQQNTNLKFETAHSMPAADIFVITREQWKVACQSESYLSDVPVLVVEVLSPANRRAKVEQKLSLYLAQGVAAVWLVSPKKRCVEVCTNEKRFSETQALSLPAPLEGLVSVADFFVIPISQRRQQSLSAWDEAMQDMIRME